MAIIRIQNASNFTVINNDLINDPLLDWRDVGLLTFLLSKPDNWEVSTAHLQQQKNSGRDAIHASLRSIIAAGYAKRNVSRVGGWTYEVSNAPIYRLATTPNTEKPNTEKPNTEKPNTEKPNTEKPNTEKRPQVNTDIQQELKEQQILNSNNSASAKFKKPTFEELSAFCLESGLSIDVQHFLDYYESKGWLVGKAPMKSWQASARNWARNNFSKPNTAKQPPKPSSEYRYVPTSTPREFDNAIDSYAINENTGITHDTQ